MTLFVSIFRHREIRGWPTADGSQLATHERAYQYAFGAAVERDYTTDAHMTAYTSTLKRRLRREAIASGQAVALIGVQLLDVDCPETHGTKEPAPASWRMQMRRKFYALLKVHPGGYYYETRGGARIAYRLPSPVTIATRADEERWSKRYAVTRTYLQREFCIDADAACADWTRFFRLPHATRGDAGPEDWMTIGDPSELGVLDAKPNPYDLDGAQEHRAFKTRGKHVAPPVPGAASVLHEMLLARGHLHWRRADGAWIITCPRHRLHSSGKVGDTSTLLYPPSAGKTLGAIHCMHSHCSTVSAKEWLQEFSDSERKAAESVVGNVYSRGVGGRP